MIPRDLLIYASLTLAFVHGTQIMRRPDDYMSTPNTYEMEESPQIETIHRRTPASEKTSFGYFTNWGTYGPNFQPTDIVTSYLTHILYAFADIDQTNFAITLTDAKADEKRIYPGDNPNEQGNNLYGCLKQLYLLKLKQRNLKIILSVGGWTYSQKGHFKFVTSKDSRDKFVQSAVEMIENYGLDGIDIDNEYPSTDQEAQGFADLLSETRAAFDNLKSKKKESVPYLLTAAVSAGPNSKSLKVKQMDSALDYWNLMSFDYAGNWSTVADNQANVYGGEISGINTNSSLQWYLDNGASNTKMNIGMPLYGRAFEKTEGLGKPFDGVGPGTTEPGAYSYNTLPLKGSLVYENLTSISSYSYDGTKKELVSYDTPNIVAMKTSYLKSRNLGGAMFWELSTDKVGTSSLVGIVSRALGELDKTPNHISYPNSKWDNVRNNFGQSSVGTNASNSTLSNSLVSNSSSSNSDVSNSTSLNSSPMNSKSSSVMSNSTSLTSLPTNSTLSTSSVSNSTASILSTDETDEWCCDAPEWSGVTSYSVSQEVSYNDHLWTAKMSSQNEIPGSGNSWTDGGPCTNDS